MVIAPDPPNESRRLARLRRTGLLDTPDEEAFDALTRTASILCEVPIALISLVDHDRQWFKSRFGLDAQQTPRDISFCAHTILDTEIMEIPDALEDERFRENALVRLDPRIRYYAGSPLVTPEGEALGTLCVIDRQPRKLSELQLEGLRSLGRAALRLIELKEQNRNLRDEMAKLIQSTSLPT